MAIDYGTFTWPSASSAANPSVGLNGSPAPTSSTEIGLVTPGGILVPASGDTSGNANVNIVNSALPAGAATAANQATALTRLSGSLVPTAFNEIDLTYITSGNGTGQVGTALYKLTGTLAATLTLTYDASNRLSTVVKS